MTNREQQVLAGLLAGLSTRQIMEQMAVTENTFKTHMRAIGIKMRVESRVGILEKVLDDRLARQRAA